MARVAPIVLDLGKRKRELIQELKRGRGELAEELEAALDKLEARLGEELAGKTILPVVVLYGARRRAPRSALPVGR